MKAHFETFAAYNAWANRRLCDAAAVMTDEARKAEAGAFFRSLHLTLNHLVVTDLLWMGRGEQSGPRPASLSAEPYPDFDDLRAAREALDDRIIAFIRAETDESLTREITYSTITGPKTVTQRLHETLPHVFNHQTHHRGQCHHMLTAAGRDAPPLDLLYFQNPTE